MASKSMKPTMNIPRPVAREMTEEEKQARLTARLIQQRETYALNILCNLCHNAPQTLTTAEGVALVQRAVEMADALCAKLYTE